MTSLPTKNTSIQTERRQFYRRIFQGTLEIEWGSEILTGAVRDIGPRGLFVELTPPLWIGATFSARLILKPDLKLNCTVRRVEPGKGIAVEFDLPEDNGRTQLDTFLATLPPL
jgi:PilZ domain